VRSKTSVGVRNVASWRRTPSLATGSTVAAETGIEDLIESHAVSSTDTSIYKPRAQASWKRERVAVDSATYAAAELIADILGSHADLLTETFVGSNSVLHTRAQARKQKRDPALVDTAAGVASVTTAKLGDTLLLVDTFADTSALGVLNLRGQADWKRSTDLGVDSVTTYDAIVELGPDHASSSSGTLAGVETKAFSDTEVLSGLMLGGTGMHSDAFVSSSVGSTLQTRDLLSGVVDETVATNLLGSKLTSTTHVDALRGRKLNDDVSSANAAANGRVNADAQLESTAGVEASLLTAASVGSESATELAANAAVVAGSDFQV